MARLGNINLFVRDVDRAAQFYVDVLGLTEDTERSHRPGFVLLNAGSVQLTLQDASSPDAAFGRTTSIELGFEAEDVEAVRQKFLAQGIEAGEVQQMGWGGGFDATDLDGHRLTVYKMRN